MKSVRERMDMIAAYREVGSYRGAADICATTPKTVKRAVLKADRAEAEAAQPAHNYDEVAELVAEKVEKTNGRISAKPLLPVARAAGYGGSARNFRRLVAKAKAKWRSITVGAGVPGCGPRATCWSSTGARSGRCSCSARCSRGAAGGSCTSPTTSGLRRPSPRSPRVSKRT